MGSTAATEAIADAPGKESDFSPRSLLVLLSSLGGIATGSGLFLMTASLFIIPLREELGWSTTQVTIAPIVLMMTAVLAPFVGLAIDRFGPRRIALIALVGLGTGYAMLSMVPANLYLFYAAVIFIGLMAPLGNAMPYLKGVAGWFGKNVGLAFGITQSAASLAGLVGMPIVGMIIAGYGWRWGYMSFTIAIAFIGLPLVLAFFRERPGATATAHVAAPLAPPGGTSVGQALRDPRMWILIVAFALATLPVGGLSAHLVPILVERQFNFGAAASIGSAYAAGMLLGRIGGGFLLDRVWPHIVPAAAVLLSAIGLLILIFPGASTFGAILAVLLIGLTHGVEGDVLAYFILRMFGLKHFSALIGVMTAIMAGAMSLGGLSAALLYDATQTYQAVSAISAALFIASGVAILYLGYYERGLARKAAGKEAQASPTGRASTGE